MPTLYFSLWSEDSAPLARKIAGECESFLEAECIWGRDTEPFAPGKIRERLARCDVLIVVVNNSGTSATASGLPVNNSLLKERIRAEIVLATNFDLTIISLLIDDARLPAKENLPGALKRLLDCKTYRLRSALWFEDLHELLEDIQEELDFKRDTEERLTQTIDFPDLTESNPSHKLGLEFSGAHQLRRVVESEKFNLEKARRAGDRVGEKNALSALALAFSQLKQTQTAIQYFQEQLEIVRELKGAEEECALLANLGDAFAISGNMGRAKNYYEEQLARADAMGFRPFIGSAFNGLGFVYVKQNKISKAIACYSKALALYQELENGDKELELLVGIGLNYQKLGEMSQTASFLEQAWETSKRLENRNEEARVLVDLAETYSQLGNSERAHQYLQRAEEMLNRMEEPWVVSWKHRLTSLKDSLHRG